LIPTFTYGGINYGKIAKPQSTNGAG